MSKNTTRVWEIGGSGSARELHFKDQSDLDAITRQLPDGYYSTFRTYAEGQRILGLSAHLDRLFLPASELNLKPVCTNGDLRQAMNSLLDPFRPKEMRVRIVMDNKAGRFFVAIQPLELPPPKAYQLGVHVVTTQVQRETPRQKKTSFIVESQSERASIKRTSSYEGLIVKKGRILEGLTSNFFYVEGGVLGTAGRGILRGITREEILHLAREQLRFTMRYRALRVSEIPLIQEAFISSSSRGIVPVVRIDALRISAGFVGVLTKELMRGYQDSVLKRAESIL